MSLSEEAALEKELKEKVQSYDETAENDQPLESMAGMGHDINDDINEISDAEAGDTRPRKIIFKLN